MIEYWVRRGTPTQRSFAQQSWEALLISLLCCQHVNQLTVLLLLLVNPIDTNTALQVTSKVLARRRVLSCIWPTRTSISIVARLCPAVGSISSTIQLLLAHRPRRHVTASDRGEINNIIAMDFKGNGINCRLLAGNGCSLPLICQT